MTKFNSSRVRRFVYTYVSLAIFFCFAFGEGNNISLNPELRKQHIDGFGGSIAFWGTHADQQAVELAVDLGVKFIRIQGEVTPSGIIDNTKDILDRAIKMNPQLEVLVTFWQPRSSEHLETAYWMHEHEGFYELKKERYGEWAHEMAKRVKVIQSWGVKIAAVAIQNEANYSHIGAQTCRWNPEDLRIFVDQYVKKYFQEVGITAPIAATDLAYSGHLASEFKRFSPVYDSTAVDIISYHMYDSYKHDTQTPPTMQSLIDFSKVIGETMREKYPNKKLWMTETTGAQWNSADWHTYGWKKGITEHEQAIKAVEYLHHALVHSEANTFFWWGLIYSTAPKYKKNPNDIQKHRDEGLVLVSEDRSKQYQKFLECTKKYYTFKHFTKFVKPAFIRIDTPQHDNALISAFISPNAQQVVCVVINPDSEKLSLNISPTWENWKVTTYETETKNNLISIDPASAQAGQSVRTYIFDKN